MKENIVGNGVTAMIEALDFRQLFKLKRFEPCALEFERNTEAEAK